MKLVGGINPFLAVYLFRLINSKKKNSSPGHRCHYTLSANTVTQFNGVKRILGGFLMIHEIFGCYKTTLAKC